MFQSSYSNTKKEGHLGGSPAARAAVKETSARAAVKETSARAAVKETSARAAVKETSASRNPMIRALLCFGLAAISVLVLAPNTVSAQSGAAFGSKDDFFKKVRWYNLEANRISGVAAAFDSSKVNISNFSYSGTGCAQGSVAYDVSTDKKALTILFDDFSVATDGATGGNSDRDKKNCRVNLGISAPNGWQFSLIAMRFAGYASLDQGVRGVQNAVYRLDKQDPIKLGRFRLDGPYDDDYGQIHNVPLENASWSKCGSRKRNLMINASVAVTSRKPNAEGYMTLDSIDGEILHSYGLVWRKCRGGSPSDSVSPDGAKTFTRTLYRGILGRKADAGGLKFHAGRLVEGRTCAQVGEDLVQSDEGKKYLGRQNNVNKVKGLFVGLLGRKRSTLGGINSSDYYVKHLDKGSKTLLKVAREIMGSEEFKNRCKKLGLKESKTRRLRPLPRDPFGRHNRW